MKQIIYNTTIINNSIINNNKSRNSISSSNNKNGISRGVLQIRAFFEVGKNSKKGDIIYHNIEKRFLKFGNSFFGLENIFILLYTTSDYYSNTALVLGVHVSSPM